MNENIKNVKTLVLIDGNAIVHRAYHALPKNMSSRGVPTNAVYGFALALIKVIEDLKPDYLATSFDLAGPTFRHIEYKEYKGTRVKADQELYDQIPIVKEMLQIMNIPNYEKEGYEADDCLGTIADNVNGCYNTDHPHGLGTDAAIQTYIVSGDKDIFQLIDKNVKVYNLRRGMSDTQIVDEKTIKEQYGLDPADFIDLKALAGDPSDNIPGVPGVGVKTATKLLQKFDTLENLYKEIVSGISYQVSGDKNKTHDTLYEIRNTSLKNISPRILKLLIEYKDQAFMSQKLAMIEKSVPITVDLESMKWGEYDKEKLRQFFLELNFKSLLRRFGIIESSEGEKPSKKATIDQKERDSQLRLL